MKEGNGKARAKRVWELFLGFLPMICAALIMAHFRLWGIQMGKDAGWIISEIFLFMISGLVANNIIVTAHELGHWFLGTLTGHRLLYIQTGVTTHVRVNGKFYRGRQAIYGAIGSCAMAPPSDDYANMPVVALYLGGVLMNLLLAGVSAVLFFIIPWVDVKRFWVVLFVKNVFTTFWNLIPWKGGRDNDGASTLHLLKNPRAKYGCWWGARLEERIVKGERLRDMPAELFELPWADADLKDPFILQLPVNRIFREWDLGNFAVARQEAEALLSTIPDMVSFYKIPLMLMLLFDEIIGERRPEVIEKLLTDEVRERLGYKGDLVNIRILYAYAALVLKDEKQAGNLRLNFESLARQYPFPQVVEGEQELLAIVDARRATLRRRVGTAPVSEEKSAEWFYKKVRTW